MINKSRISYKIFITVASAIFTLFFFSSYISYSLVSSLIASHLDQSLYGTVHNIGWIVEKSVSLSSRSYIQALAEQYADSIANLQLQEESGDVSRKVLQDRIFAQFSSKLIGKSGYTYIINSDGVIMYHPVVKLVGTDISNENFVKEQIARKNGFLEYEWKNPQDSKSRSKILYMKYFEPWDWIISVSAYKDELPQLVNLIDFKDDIQANSIGSNGYSFILDLDGNILMHPTLKGNISAINEEEPKKILQHIVESGKGKLTYTWHGLGEDRSGKKLAVFDTLADLHWIVVATGYVDDFYKPLEVLKKVLVVHLIIAFIFSILISYYLSRYITLPLNNLLRQISDESNRLNFSQETSLEKNEIEILSDYFSQYVHQLKEKNDKLAILLEDQQKTSFDLAIYKNIFDNIAEGVSITDGDGAIIEANTAFEKITGYDVKEVVGQNPRLLKSDRHPAEFYQQMWKAIKEQGFWSGTIWNKRKSGEEYPEWLTISAVKDRNGDVINYAGVFDDITELVEQQSRIEFLAYHDTLTEIPNRFYIQERLVEMLSESKRNNDTVVCIICDLENFKAINDSLGQEIADEVLKLFVQRLKPLVRREDILGRLGGDDFVLVFKTLQLPAEYAVTIIERIFAANTSPIQVSDTQIYITLNVGISHYPTDGSTAEEILKQANLALNDAEKTKGNSFRFFSKDMEEEVHQKIHYLAKIREGLDNDEFIPFYQPKINLITGRVTGMEALARWQSGDQLVPPWRFIPVAEDSGLIIQMSDQIYRKAFNDTAELIAQGFPLKLSVNLSPVQLQASDFLKKFIETQESSGLETKNIELEITESLLFENTENVSSLLKKIVETGFSISIDDFGTGYSSLQYLKHLPLDTLKIDMSFVNGIGQDRDDEQLVRTIILLAKQFGLHVVAEGIENEEQIIFLKNLGCNDGQGYFFAKPAAFMDFQSWLTKRKRSREEE